MTQQEVIKAFMHSLDETEMSGRAALDEAVRASSNFKNFQEVANKFKADTEATGNWNTFLQKYCGIIIDNADTGAVTGSDAGGTEKTPDGVLPATGDAAYPEGTSFTVKGVTIYGIPPRETLTEAQQLVIRGLYSWWIRDSLELIEESYGLSYTEAGTTSARLRMKFIDDSDSSTMAYVSFGSPNNSEKEWESQTLCVNMAFFKDITPDDRHGYNAKFDDYLDRVLAHELTHGVMASNLNYYYDLPSFLYEGGTAELVHGVDDMRRESLIEYAKNPDLVSNLLTMKYSAGNAPYEVYAGGYLFMRYFLKQAADTTFDYDTYRARINLGSGGKFANNYFDDVTINGGSGADTISNSGDEVSMSGGNGNDALINYGDGVTVRGGSGNDSILNGTSYDAESAVVYGDAGNDTLTNFGVNSTLYGGAGSDYIINRYYGENSRVFGDADNDKIENYAAGSSIDGGKGADSIANYAANVLVDGGADNDIIKNTSYTFSNGDTTIRGDNATILGGAGNDSIVNESSNVYIDGGAGNDTIENYGEAEVHGGAGNDVFYTLYDNDDDNEAALIYGDAGKDYFFSNADDATMFGGADNDSIYNYGDGVEIHGDAGNDSLYNAGILCTVTGDAGADNVINEGGQALIDLGAGNDSLKNDGDHATIIGGAGNDTITNSGKHIVYQLTGGKDIVFGANDGDTLQLSSEKYSTRANGSDFIVSVGGSSITFKDGAELTFNVSAGDFSDTITASAGLSYNSTKALLTVDKNFTGENVSLAQNVQKVTASNFTSGVNLSGNALNNSIRGGSGDDTLFGGAGNDTLTGGSGADIFVYDGGNDIITDYRAGADKIQIDSKIIGASISGSDVVFETDGGTLSVKSGKNKNLTVINNGDETTEKYTPWFVENNFVAAEIDSITDEKFAVTNFETATENLAQVDNILAYSEK